ncbi:MAG TPA: M48 family metallopeptidase [Gillisia sp.]|nr:M48 family metallopeptidase [Gillisia sp.]
MKNKFFYLAFIFSYTFAIAQQRTEVGLENIIEEYKATLESTTRIMDCGHFLDTPASFVKDMENRSLDAMLPFTDVNKDKLGREIYRDVLKANKVVKNHPAEKEISNIISKLVNSMQPENKRKFDLIILDTEIINAFTTFGGYIYLTTGLLNFVDSYDELAFILGHEIGHEIELHTQRKITKLIVSSNIMSRVSLEEYKDLAIGINTKISAPFSQIDEYEADQYGFLLAEKAGYDVNHFDDFFEKIEKYDDKSILKKMTSTHPFAEDRKNCINEYISK